jgi:hypothetical protein
VLKLMEIKKAHKKGRESSFILAVILGFVT